MDKRLIEEGLVKGGQGRSAEEILYSANGCLGIMVGVLLALVIWAAVWVVTR